MSLPGDWILEGLCAQVDPELFHVDKGQTSRTAKLVCGRCPVQLQCLTWALDTDQKHGIWGGATPRERRHLQRTRKAAA